MSDTIALDEHRQQASITVAELPAVMSPAQLAKELDVSVRTLERWRIDGTGPKYLHPSERIYRYFGADVAAWLEAGAR